MLYHAGYIEIKDPDIHHGRVNADFGQGFYMTDDESFAKRWAKDGDDVIINCYELDDMDLKIKRFERDAEWFDYIFDNRRARPDRLAEYDLIIGPVANDTIYDTMGIMTSGFLKTEEAVKLLLIGPCYKQIVLKTEKAKEKLKFISSEHIIGDNLKDQRKILKKEEDDYLTEFAEVMKTF